jgi:DNA helicase IV
MIDETQEFAPLELALMGRTLKPGGTLIVAGDAHQQMDATATFVGWPEAMRDLGHPDYETAQLEIDYRCPPEVVSLARAVLDPAAAATASTPLHRVHDEGALLDWLASNLGALQRRDRRASVAILCRSPLTARRVVAELQRREMPARVVFDGRFLARGVQVTTVDQVKGLEFDFVVVPDADARSYPDEERSRRWLYVAVTRARHQVVLACVGNPSPTLPS